MVAYLPAIVLVLCLSVLPAGGGEGRPLCLSCHPSHYTDRGACSACHRGNPAAGRKEIAHQRLIAGRFASFTLGETPVVREGERLMERLACRRCHVGGGRGNRLATNLDTLLETRPLGEIAAAIRSPAVGMPDFRLDEEQVVQLVNAVLGGAHTPGGPAGKRPLVVHFENRDKPGKDLFTRNCGACHRALTARLGMIGRGDNGPNLSGLLSPWYPRTFREREGWSAGRLKKWLENPRAVRPWSRMRPLELSAAEFGELTEILGVFPPGQEGGGK